MKGKILVVEDDPSILRGLQLNLSMEGYLVRSAMDGETGLALARSESPDLLLVDVMLPRMGASISSGRSARRTRPLPSSSSRRRDRRPTRWRGSTSAPTITW
jgi:DNA-binding response OmpR family regulator